MASEIQQLEEELESYADSALTELGKASNAAELASWHQRYLGRTGQTGLWKRRVGSLDPEVRPAVGRKANSVAETLAEAYERRSAEVVEHDSREAAVDVTFPPRDRRRGGIHPVMAMLEETLEIFRGMGFSVFRSPHVELDSYNFGLLNMAPDHPARDMQDTFYVSPDVVLRTHTSAGQVRAMRANAPAPLKVVMPGLNYRHEDVTPRSEMQFYQVEGLMVGPGVRLSDLKGILLAYARHAFGPTQEVRLRASYFPFTEPSVEIDIRCTICAGEGCRVCKFTGWLELLGGGLVHPVVLRNGGYDPEQVSGIAWGMGIERPLMLRHGINDIRQFFRNDLRFLEQFSMNLAVRAAVRR